LNILVFEEIGIDRTGNESE
jgi:hypothetical protein